MRIMLLVQMRTIVVVAMTAALMAILVSIVGTPAVNSISAVTDNKTDAGTGGGNGSSSIEAADGRPGNGESAKSGINTTVCGPDAAHACQTSSGGQ
jgi:hypothetical protein